MTVLRYEGNHPHIKMQVFLGAFAKFEKRLLASSCLPVCLSVCLSVCPSVRQSIRPSVRPPTCPCEKTRLQLDGLL
jgi:hypothetical protein